MNDLPIGLSTGCFYQSRIVEVLEDIRNGGFSLLEICSFPKHLDYHDDDAVGQASEMIQGLGLEARSLHAPFADHIDITSFDERKREDSVADLLQACRAAAALQVRYLVLHPGPEREGRPPEKEHAQRLHHASGAINRVARHCRQLGIDLLLENMLPHLLFGNTADMMYLLGEIDETNVGACLDTGHAFLAGDLSRVVHKLSGHLKMIHVNDNLGDCDAHLPPGHGSIAWDQLFSELEHYQFSGTLILELAGDAEQPPAVVLEKAREARRFLRVLASNRPGGES